MGFRHSLMTWGEKFSATEIDDAFREFKIDGGMIDGEHLKGLMVSKKEEEYTIGSQPPSRRNKQKNRKQQTNIVCVIEPPEHVINHPYKAGYNFHRQHPSSWLSPIPQHPGIPEDLSKSPRKNLVYH